MFYLVEFGHVLILLRYAHHTYSVAYILLFQYKPVMSDQDGSPEAEGSQETEESSQEGEGEVESADTCSQITTETDGDPGTTG